MHDLIVGWSDDETYFGCRDCRRCHVKWEQRYDTGNGTATRQYLFVWRADADGGDPTEVHVAGLRRNSRSYVRGCGCPYR